MFSFYEFWDKRFWERLLLRKKVSIYFHLSKVKTTTESTDNQCANKPAHRGKLARSNDARKATTQLKPSRQWNSTGRTPPYRTDPFSETAYCPVLSHHSARRQADDRAWKALFLFTGLTDWHRRGFNFQAVAPISPASKYLWRTSDLLPDQWIWTYHLNLLETTIIINSSRIIVQQPIAIDQPKHSRPLEKQLSHVLCSVTFLLTTLEINISTSLQQFLHLT